MNIRNEMVRFSHDDKTVRRRIRNAKMAKRWIRNVKDVEVVCGSLLRVWEETATLWRPERGGDSGGGFSKEVMKMEDNDTKNAPNIFLIW
jgi:hypothetical protein